MKTIIKLVLLIQPLKIVKRTVWNTPNLLLINWNIKILNIFLFNSGNGFGGAIYYDIRYYIKYNQSFIISNSSFENCYASKQIIK